MKSLVLILIGFYCSDALANPFATKCARANGLNYETDIKPLEKQVTVQDTPAFRKYYHCLALQFRYMKNNVIVFDKFKVILNFKIKNDEKGNQAVAKCRAEVKQGSDGEENAMMVSKCIAQKLRELGYRPPQ